jgi:hypothetical protein
MRGLVAALLLGCTDKGGGTGSGDTGLCADAPVIMWNNFGDGFLTENCQACHASTSTNRYDAPEDVVFDTLDDVKAHADAMLLAATGDDPRMPPEGGVDDEDRLKLEIWLTCWLDEDEG